MQNYDIIDNQNSGIKPGSFYNTWGLAFVLIFLFLFQLVFYFIAVYTAGLFYGLSFTETQNLLSEPDGTATAINLARYTNFVSFTGYMFLPVLLFGIINRTGIIGEGGLRIKPKMPLFFLGLLMLALAVPLVDYITSFMQNIPFPQNVKYFADSLENSRSEHLDTILDMHQIPELVVCLIIVGLLPAIFEELMFRGVLMNIFKGITQKNNTAVILQSLVFTVLHFSVYEFPGIFLMGALFGFIAIRTGTIWYGVVMHFIFNSISIVFAYLNHIEFDKTGVFGKYELLHFNLMLGIAALFGIWVLARLFKKVSQQNNELA